MADNIFNSEIDKAFGKAVDYLSRCMKTEREIEKYLLGKGLEWQICTSVIEKLKSYRYVDDKTYIKLYVEQNERTKGVVRLSAELCKRGISKELIEEFFENADSDNFCQNAQRVADKFLKNKPHDFKTLQKLQRHLISRGYTYDQIGGIVRKFKDELSDITCEEQI